MSDRRGPLLPTRITLVAATAMSLGLATSARPLAYVPLIVLAAISYGVLFTTAFALLADGAEQVGLPQGMGFGLMNAAWAAGAACGPAAASVVQVRRLAAGRRVVALLGQTRGDRLLVRQLILRRLRRPLVGGCPVRRPDAADLGERRPPPVAGVVRVPGQPPHLGPR